MSTEGSPSTAGPGPSPGPAVSPRQGRRGRLRVALAQVDAQLGDVEANVERAVTVIAEAEAEGAELVVFPELSLTGYHVGALDRPVAMRLDDERLDALVAATRRTAALVGFAEHTATAVYNSAALIADGRVVNVQRKLYLPTYREFEEAKHFGAGDALLTHDWSGTRLATLICNDAWQPPLPFLAAHDGARVLLIPTCSSTIADSPSAPEFDGDWMDLLRVWARLLEVVVIFVNRVGRECGRQFWGGSRVIGPYGQTLAEAPRWETAVVYADIDLTSVDDRRLALPLLKDPRLDLLLRQFERLAN